MQVFVTPHAERNFDTIVDYIKDKWGERTAVSFPESWATQKFPFSVYKQK